MRAERNQDFVQNLTSDSDFKGKCYWKNAILKGISDIYLKIEAAMLPKVLKINKHWRLFRFVK